MSYLSAQAVLKATGSLLKTCLYFPEQARSFTLQLESDAQVSSPIAGVLRYRPERPSQHYLLLSCGVHGNETAPIELVDQLGRELISGRGQCQINLLLIVGSPHAVMRSQRFIDFNLNRLFAGGHEQFVAPGEKPYLETHRARSLEREVRQFFASDSASVKIHYDLHTAIRPSTHQRFAIAPYTEKGEQLSTRQATLLANSNIDAVLLYHKPATTFSSFTRQLGCEAFTLELGKVNPFGQNDLKALQPLRAKFEDLLDGKAEEIGAKAPPESNSLLRYQVIGEIIRESEDFVLHCADDMPNFTAFNKGYVIAQSGATQLKIEQDGDCVVFPNPNVPVGQRAGIIVRKL